MRGYGIKGCYGIWTCTDRTLVLFDQNVNMCNVVSVGGSINKRESIVFVPKTTQCCVDICRIQKNVPTLCAPGTWRKQGVDKPQEILFIPLSSSPDY